MKKLRMLAAALAMFSLAGTATVKAQSLFRSPLLEEASKQNFTGPTIIVSNEADDVDGDNPRITNMRVLDKTNFFAPVVPISGSSYPVTTWEVDSFEAPTPLGLFSMNLLINVGCDQSSHPSFGNIYRITITDGFWSDDQPFFQDGLVQFPSIPLPLSGPLYMIITKD